MTEEQKKRLTELQAKEEKGEVTNKEINELKDLSIISETGVEVKIGEKTRRDFGCEIKSIDEENFELVAIASTNSIDRYGDIVDQESWNLKKFKKNPVILANHHYTVQNIIGKAKRVWIEDGKLKIKVKFAVEESELAASVWKLILGGYLNAWSVGFIPFTFEYEKDKKGDTQRYLKDCELLELSAVAVPANADCLTNALKKGIIKEDEAKTVREVFGKEFKEKEEKLLTEQKEKTLEENKNILKFYRKIFKELNSTLNLEPTGDETKDIQEMVKMLNFCLGLDERTKKKEDKNEIETKKPSENPKEAKTRTATHKDLLRIRKSINIS